MDATLNRLRVREIPSVPVEVVESFKGHKTTLVPFEDRVRVISDPSLRTENGVAEFPDGSFMVSVSCPMHGVTKEMLTWWVWWFPQDAERFRAWLPESNLELTYAEDDADYFQSESMPPFRPVTLYPYQSVGDISLPFRIDLVYPKDFGFSDEDVRSAGDPLIYCGHIKARKGRILYSDFVYSAYETDYGCLFNARFWIGRTNGNLLLRLLLLNERRMMGLASTCYQQYSCLDGILPEVYGEHHR